MESRIGLSSLAARSSASVAPRVPVDRVVRVLQQVRAGLASEPIGHRPEGTRDPRRPIIGSAGSPKFESRSGNESFPTGPATEPIPSIGGERTYLSESRSQLEAAPAKLADEDREVVEEALAKAERTEAELRYLADHDSLTGLLNRRCFRAKL